MTDLQDYDKWLTEIAQNMRSFSPTLFTKAHPNVLDFFYQRESWLFEQIRKRLGDEMMKLVSEDESV